MSDPNVVPTEQPPQLGVEHTSEQNFEPDNESKRLRNQMGEVAVGEPSAQEAAPEGAVNISNEMITLQNQTADEFPAGDQPQTAEPEPWRTIPPWDAEARHSANEEAEERNKTPERVVGAVSADTIPPPPEPDPVGGLATPLPGYEEPEEPEE